MMKFPCPLCITRSVCINRYKEGGKRALTLKCSLLDEYLKFDTSTVRSRKLFRKRSRTAHRFFNKGQKKQFIIISSSSC